MKLIHYLKSNTFAVIISILSMIVQSFHSFTAFHDLSSLKGTGWGIAQAVLFAIVVDFAILFYTVRKNIKVAWMAGFAMFLINGYYYYSHWGLTWQLIPGLFLSLIIPVSNYFYSEEITEDSDTGLDGTIAQMSNQLRIQQNAFKRVSDELALARQMLDEREVGKYEEALDGTKLKVQEPHPKGFAQLKSESQKSPEDKSLVNIISTDRPVRP